MNGNCILNVLRVKNLDSYVGHKHPGRAGKTLFRSEGEAISKSEQLPFGLAAVGKQKGKH